MPTYTININALTMAGKDTTQDADRAHDADGYTWTVSNGKQHYYDYNTTAPAGQANFHIYRNSTLSVDDVFIVETALGNAVEVKGNRDAYFRGDAYFSATAFMQLLKNPFSPGTFTSLGNNYIANSVGVAVGGYTTAAMLLLSVPDSVFIYNTDYRCLFMWNGLQWEIQETDYVISKSANYSLQLYDRTVIVTGSTTITLPATAVTGKKYTIKNVGVNTVTIDGNGNNIDGAATYLLSASNQSVELFFDGTNWNVK